MCVKNVGTPNIVIKIGAFGVAANSPSTSQRSRCTVQVNSIICPKHGLSRREAGDQCAECNKDRAREFKEREGSMDNRRHNGTTLADEMDYKGMRHENGERALARLKKELADVQNPAYFQGWTQEQRDARIAGLKRLIAAREGVACP